MHLDKHRKVRKNDLLKAANNGSSLEDVGALLLEVTPDLVAHGNCRRVTQTIHYPDHLGHRFLRRRRGSLTKFAGLSRRAADETLAHLHLRALDHGVKHQAIQIVKLTLFRAVGVDVLDALLQVNRR